MTRLSIVDLATVAPGATETEGLADALETARRADALGFHRIWFAEHHVTAAHASHLPELLIAAAATQTSRIRVGSGAVLLNHQSPFRVAETFRQLHALAPGRIDLGLGRATSGPVIDRALQRDRRSPFVDDHAEQVAEVVAWLDSSFPPGHPFAGTRLVPSVPGGPQVWLLGSSAASGPLAAALGLGYTYAAFINPQLAAPALRRYRAGFTPRASGPPGPRAMLAVNVTVGETEADGQRLVLSAKGYYARLMRGAHAQGIPTPAEAIAELTLAQREEPTTIVDGAWPRFVAGDAQHVRATLERMQAESGADELMVQDLIADPADRHRTHALLAEAFALSALPVAP